MRGGEGGIYVFLLSGNSFKKTLAETAVEEDLNQGAPKEVVQRLQSETGRTRGRSLLEEGPL